MKNVGNNSRGRSQGVPKIFRAPMYRAHCAVILCDSTAFLLCICILVFVLPCLVCLSVRYCRLFFVILLLVSILSLYFNLYFVFYIRVLPEWRINILFSANARSWDHMSSVCPSDGLSVTLVICDHIGWKSRKLIARTISPTPSLFVAERRST